MYFVVCHFSLQLLRNSEILSATTRKGVVPFRSSPITCRAKPCSVGPSIVLSSVRQTRMCSS